MNVIALDDVALAHDLLEDSVRVASAKMAVRVMVSQLSDLYDDGDQEGLRHAVAEFILNEDVRTIAARHLWRRKYLDEGLTLEEVTQAAFRVNIYGKQDEPVRLRIKAKPNGRYRVIYDFALKHRLAQEVICFALSPIYRPRAFQFGLKGRDKAIRRLKELVEDGNIYACHLDIEEFYASFDLGKLTKNAPLPPAVVAHAVHARHLEFCWNGGALKRFPLL